MRLSLGSISGFFLVPLCTHFAVSQAAPTAPAARTISTTGDAVVYVSPDEVDIQFGVQTYDKDLDRSGEINEAAGKKLVWALAAQGIEPKDIQTDDVQLSVDYKDREARGGVAGYTSRRTFLVKVRDVKLLAAVIRTGIKYGVNQLPGVEYHTKDLRKYRDQARQMAIHAAREEADALAEELDATVGKPWTISEGGGAFFSRFANNIAQNAASREAPDNDAGESLPPGRMAIRAQISVTFDLVK